MSTIIDKKTFSIRKEFSTYLDKFQNKSKFINEALAFYIEYLKSLEAKKNSFLEAKILEALHWEFHAAQLTKTGNKNKTSPKKYSTSFEDSLRSALKN